MTSTHSQTMLSGANQFAGDLVRNARSDVAVKLQAVDEACRSIIESGGTVSVASVRGWLSTNRGMYIAASTLMNLRNNPQTGEKNYAPARLIINSYIDAQKGLRKRGDKISEHNFGSLFLNDSEIKEINDHQVRYKVQLMVGRVRNLETQLNQLRTINNLPVLPPATLSQNYLPGIGGQSSVVERNQSLILDEEELRALNDFLDEKSMKRRRIAFGDNGTLKATYSASSQTSTCAISKPFLEDALRKILRSYDPA